MRIEIKIAKQMWAFGTKLDALDGKPKIEFLGIKFVRHKLPRFFKEWKTVNDPRCRCSGASKNLYEQNYNGS